MNPGFTKVICKLALTYIEKVVGYTEQFTFHKTFYLAIKINTEYTFVNHQYLLKIFIQGLMQFY